MHNRGLAVTMPRSVTLDSNNRGQCLYQTSSAGDRYNHSLIKYHRKLLTDLTVTIGSNTRAEPSTMEASSSEKALVPVRRPTNKRLESRGPDYSEFHEHRYRISSFDPKVCCV